MLWASGMIFLSFSWAQDTHGRTDQPCEKTCPPEELHLDYNNYGNTKPYDCPSDDGYFKDVHNCGRYFHCRAGVSTSRSCSNSSWSGLYDYNLEECRLAEEVDCEERPVCVGEPPEYNKCRCQGEEIVTGFECPLHPSVEVFNDPFNCQHLIICLTGAQLGELFCEDGEYGDEESGSCVPGDGRSCGGRPICGDKENSKDCYCYNL